MTTPETGGVRTDADLTETIGGAEFSDRPGSFSLDIDRRGLGDGVRGYIYKLRSGDPGALPSVLGIIVLAIIFSQVSSRFLGKANIGNIPSQGAYIAFIALGLVFVLLLGEIDLSAGTTGGMAASFAAEAVVSGNLRHGISGLLFWLLVAGMAGAIVLGLYLRTYSGPVVVAVGLVLLLTNSVQHVIPALLFAVTVGAAVGIYIGWLVGKVGIPSFIVTLALFLAWQGVLQLALNTQAQGISGYNFWYDLANANLSPLASWIFTIVVVGGYTLYTLAKSLRAQAQGLAADKLALVAVRAAVIIVIGVLVTYYMNLNRNTNPFKKIQGLPYALVVPVALMIVCTIALTKTTWGRHLFATGGSAEAARRAGIDVTQIRVTAFTLCSSFGAIGGVFLASFNGAATLDLGAGNVLLFAVAAAVIGGTSLFGGRGRPRDAIIGAIVITMIPNGLQLRTSIPPQLQSVITGVVLLIAAAVDALSRRRSRAR